MRLWPLRLWLCRDTSVPKHYPPRAREEFVRRRVAMGDLRFAIIKAASQLPEDPDRALDTLMRAHGKFE